MTDIIPGRFYRRTKDHQYGETRKVISIENDIVTYVSSAIRFKCVKLLTFAKTFPFEVPRDQPANRYALVIVAAGQPVYHLYKYNFPMEFWYSLDGQAIFAETPAASEADFAHQFDVRNLPALFTDGLEMHVRSNLEGGGISPLEALHRERAAHVAAIGRALCAGYDIRSGEREARAKADAEWDRRHQIGADCDFTDDDLPF